jgi:hypothetical protein
MCNSYFGCAHAATTPLGVQQTTICWRIYRTKIRSCYYFRRCTVVFFWRNSCLFFWRSDAGSRRDQARRSQIGQTVRYANWCAGNTGRRPRSSEARSQSGPRSLNLWNGYPRKCTQIPRLIRRKYVVRQPHSWYPMPTHASTHAVRPSVPSDRLLCFFKHARRNTSASWRETRAISKLLPLFLHGQPNLSGW